MSSTRILIVHPDPTVGTLMTSMLQTLGHRIDEAPNDRVAVRMLEHAPVSLVLAGADPDDPDALEFLTYLRRKYPKVPVVLLFPTNHPERSRDAMNRGAAAVLRFPLPATGLRAVVAQALGLPEPDSSKSQTPTNGHSNGNGSGNGHPPTNGHGDQTSVPQVPPAARTEGTNPVGKPFVEVVPIRTLDLIGAVGQDATFRHVIQLAMTIAPTRAPVLIVGERGVGKTLLARSLHRHAARSDSPLAEVACNTLKETALEVELFGRRGGGLDEPDRIGKVAAARGGTLVLDEVAALSPGLQYKLLRLLRDGEYEPVGSDTSEPAEVRVVMTTREDLAALVHEGKFRQDLYYRISVVALKLPPLRHRGEDIDRLANHFRTRFAQQISKEVVAISPEASEVLSAHSWPGNVQELEHVIERAVVVCRGLRIEPNHLALIPRELIPSRATNRVQRIHPGTNILPLKEALEGPEKELILQALEALNWNRQETARVLDINRTTLYKKMKKYGLLFDEPVWAN